MTSVLITGTSRGIGLALTATYLTRGDAVIATARGTSAALADLVASHGERLAVIPLDLTDEVAVAGLAAQIGERTIDVLINNAGVIGPQRQSGLDMDFAGFLHTLAVNTLGPLRVTQAVLPALRRARQPKVVTLSSKMGSSSETEHDRLAYRASKAAVNKVMHGLADELRPLGVAVVTLHPGWVRTDMGGKDADVTVDESVAGILTVIDSLSLETTGRFRNYNGAPVPW